MSDPEVQDTAEAPSGTVLTQSEYDDDFRIDDDDDIFSKTRKSREVHMESTDVSAKEPEELGDIRIEKTLALIKPEAVKFATDIENMILARGFSILAKRTVRLTPEQAAEFYAEHYGQTYYANLVVYMANNPIIALCLAKPNAISEWATLMGPTNVQEARKYWPDCIRASYGLLTQDDGEYLNAVHGSDDHAAAVREIHFFFPNLPVGPLLRGWQVSEYIQGKVNPTLQEGLQELCKEKPIDPIVWLADWLLINNPNTPKVEPPKGAVNRCISPANSEYDD